MHYVTYGRTGERVSTLGMGGMRWSDDITDQMAVAAIRRANELGINYFDTAPGYCNDRSEDILGKALADMPTDDWMTATKGGNEMSADEAEKKIETSCGRLGVERIDFYFLWCIITRVQMENALKPGGCLDGILRARERGLVKHVGVSSHLESAGLKDLIDKGGDAFEFLMVPYNAVNFGQRQEGVEYAVSKKLGVAAMNPLHGGIIANYRDDLKIFAGEPGNGVEEGMRFCLESPSIAVTLSGMNSISQVEENAGYASKYGKLGNRDFGKRVDRLKASFESMCTSCGYCVETCPEHIFIPAYMEAYNHYLLTGSEEGTVDRLKWHKNFGLL